MELKPLESAFFREILNAELDVPVPATLKCQGKDFDIIVVPEIAPEGYFRMKYFKRTGFRSGGRRCWTPPGTHLGIFKVAADLGTSLVRPGPRRIATPHIAVANAARQVEPSVTGTNLIRWRRSCWGIGSPG